jgi:hypothetical protein
MSSSDNTSKPGPRLVTDTDVAIPKPDPFARLEKFRVTRDPSIGTVETLLTALPHHPIAQAKDFVRLHSNQDTHWTPEYCFVAVPVKGMKRDTLHIISEEIGLAKVPGALSRFKLALASKPHDVFFLCHVPTRNLDNPWNFTNLTACETAMQSWVKATSRRAENVDGYLINHALSPKAFPEPKWPKQSLAELIEVTFAGRMIEREDHPGLLRLLGAEQDLK